MIEIHGENGKIGEVSLRGGKVAGSTPAVQDVADHMLRKHGSPQKAFQAMSTLNNGYVWAQIPAQEHAGITEQALGLAEPGTITAQLEFSAESRAKAHATASATARAHAKADTLRELRDDHGRWTRDGDALLKAATGRKAAAVRVHDHVLYGKFVQGPSGAENAARPMEVTSVRHHWEGTGKNKKRFTDLVLRDPDTGAEKEQSVKDGTSVKLFPREAVHAMGKAQPGAVRARAAPAPAKSVSAQARAPLPERKPPAPAVKAVLPKAAAPAKAVPALKAVAPVVPPPAVRAAPSLPPVTTPHGRFGHIKGGDVIPDPARRAAATAEVQHGLDLQGKFVPKIAGRQTVELTSALDEGAGGKEVTGGPILLDARITRAVGNVKKIQGLTPDEMQRREAAIGWFVPSDPQYSLADTTIAHEEGHAVADKVRPEAMTSMALWGPLSRALGLPPPGFGGKNEFTGQTLRPSLVLLKWVSSDKSGPGHSGAGAIEKAVSSYASVAPWELQAELWCEYTMNASPRPAAKIYGDYVTAQLKAQGDL